MSVYVSSELLTFEDVKELFGITDGRQLSGRGRTFPEPMARISGIPLWSLDQIRDYARSTGRVIE